MPDDVNMYCRNCGANLVTNRGVLHIRQEHNTLPIILSKDDPIQFKYEVTIKYEIYACGECGCRIMDDQKDVIIKVIGDA